MSALRPCTLLIALFFSQLCVVESDILMCDPNPCQNGGTCTDTGDGYECTCIAGYYDTNCTSFNELDPSLGCSFHQQESCSADAICYENANGDFDNCTCSNDPEAQLYDGLIDGTGCGIVCSEAFHCHAHALCIDGYCVCKPGYFGRGRIEVNLDADDICRDIDECLMEPCHPYASCANSAGSYTCTCNPGYSGDGYIDCKPTCNTHDDCHTSNGYCDTSSLPFVCICLSGFTGDGVNCTDIDECVAVNECNPLFSTCENTPGSYKCPCINGYYPHDPSLDRGPCMAYPTSCDDLFSTGVFDEDDDGYYLIDADGTGPYWEFEVWCDFREDYGITVITPHRTTWIRFWHRDGRRLLHYEYRYDVDMGALLHLISISSFCSQFMTFAGTRAAAITDEDDYWISGDGRMHRRWGDGLGEKCPCGITKSCYNATSSCNNDGYYYTPGKIYDGGKITKKENLPLTTIHLEAPLYPRTYFWFRLNELKCGDRSFDIPKTCHEGKFDYGITSDGPQLIDPDGQNGADPFWVYCNIERYAHCGVTEIRPNFEGAVTVNTPGQYVVEYEDMGKIQGLLDASQFCVQRAEYECTNAPISSGKVTFQDVNDNINTYFPGGNPADGNCGCGRTQSCVGGKQAKCNCDTMDNTTRRDFGLLTEKADLPITAYNVNELGPNGAGKIFTGALMCCGYEFGYEANCEMYLQRGETVDHTYEIDPDGPNINDDAENCDPFPVVCEFHIDPLSTYAVTIVTHEDVNEVLPISAFNLAYSLTYQQITTCQFEGLRTRSVYCTQEIEYSCTEVSLHSASGNAVWETIEGTQYSYFHGEGTADFCACGFDNTCVSCNCDSMAQGSDTGILSNKEHLPVASVDFTAVFGNQINSSAHMKVGPLKCYEVFPNCYHIVQANKQRLINEPKFRNGYFFIDADSAGPLLPFKVLCISRTTIAENEIDDGSHSEEQITASLEGCFDVHYLYASNEQIEALLQSSKYCSQKLTQHCVNYPLTDHSHYKTTAGYIAPGWAGGDGTDACGCHITGTCDGGPGYKCNCDLEDSVERFDGNWIYNKTRLAVAEVCYKFTASVSERSVKFSVTDLYCTEWLINVYPSCQATRDVKETLSHTYHISPNWRMTPFPVYCSMIVSPPVGIMVVIPVIKIFYASITVETTFTIEYHILEYQHIVEIIKVARYCEQTLTVYCPDGSYSWTSSTGANQTWPTGGACEGPLCNCSPHVNVAVGGTLRNKANLPVRTVTLSASSVTRVEVGPLKCYNIHPDCAAISKLKYWQRRNPNENDEYAIDPDQEEMLPYFPVTCDIKIGGGVSIIKIDHTSTAVARVNVTLGYSFPVWYHRCSYDQIHALALISGFCYMSFNYWCLRSPLIANAGYTSHSGYITYDGSIATSWGAAQHIGFNGCACEIVGSCPDNEVCHCTANANSHQYGHFTNRAKMPITTFLFGGQPPGGSALFEIISDLRCGAETFDLPVDCEDAYENYGYIYSGEVLIMPYSTTEPFLVYCDFIGGHVVSCIGNNFEDGIQLNENGTDVQYNGATYQQVHDLRTRVKYCFQPIKHMCTASAFNDWSWVGNYKTRNYIGIGNNGGKQCNCGRDNHYCAGDEPKEILAGLERDCNCLAVDGRSTLDAGVFRWKNYLPIERISANAGTWFLGKFCCANSVFDINECTEGFHDCDPNARCINTDGSYNCVCKRGYTGYGVSGWANGRNCPDDNECVSNPCHYGAECVNTPGSFTCTCGPGWNQTSDRHCEDIDECSDPGLNDCPINGRCINLPGSYFCRCNPGYRTNGTHCQEFGTCSCYGDPHCRMFDGKRVSSQGDCEYTMATDMCAGETSGFHVQIQNWKQNFPPSTVASWVKEVTIIYGSYTIVLGQRGSSNSLLINGILQLCDYSTPDDAIRARIRVRNTEVHLSNGVVVKWNGRSVVKIHVPGHLKDELCGICGNYNDDSTDDMIIGPHCNETEGQTTDNPNIFFNSWITPESASSSCPADCNEDDDTNDCIPEVLQLAQSFCQRLYSETSPFKECLDQMKIIDEEQYDNMREDCEYDICRTNDVGGGVCAVVEPLYLDCLTTYADCSSLGDWRAYFDCPLNCGVREVYKACGDPSSEQTCRDVRNRTIPSTSTHEPGEGCYCSYNYVRESGLCIPADECGCFYIAENGDELYATEGAEVFRGTECTERGICHNGTIDFESNTCHYLATCRIEDGSLHCDCDEGLIGDGLTFCVDDPCNPNPCDANEDCAVNSDLTGHICTCADGYIGDCDECYDIDECATQTYTCPDKSFCVNTPGSYRCDCIPGFVKINEECKDIDECDVGSANCGNHTECINELGSYRCVCCSGFENDTLGNCVASSPSVNASEKCCACTHPICNRAGPVCGNDGQQYDSARDQYEIKCKRDDFYGFDIHHFGPCTNCIGDGCCSGILCPGSQTCHEWDEGPPTCQCDIECTPEQINSPPVCSGSIVFENRCLYLLAECRVDTIPPEYEIYPETPCTGGPGGDPPYVGEWSGFGPCSVTCGQGLKTKTRPQFRVMTDEQLAETPLSVNAACYEDPCEDSLCFTKLCRPSAVCIVEDNAAKCVCPDCTNVGRNPVCGAVYIQQSNPLLGNTVVWHSGLRTWNSACDLQTFACVHNIWYDIAKDIPCPAKPTECTRVVKKEIIIQGSFSAEIDVGTCDGGCPENKEECCIVADYDEEQKWLASPHIGSTSKNRRLGPSRNPKYVSSLFEGGANRSCFTKTEVRIVKTCECRTPVLPPGFILIKEFKTSYFEVQVASYSYDQAQSLCIAAGGHLFRVDGDEERDVIFNLARTSYGYIPLHWWIDGRQWNGIWIDWEDRKLAYPAEHTGTGNCLRLFWAPGQQNSDVRRTACNTGSNVLCEYEFE